MKSYKSFIGEARVSNTKKRMNYIMDYIAGYSKEDGGIISDFEKIQQSLERMDGIKKPEFDAAVAHLKEKGILINNRFDMGKYYNKRFVKGKL